MSTDDNGYSQFFADPDGNVGNAHIAAAWAKVRPLLAVRGYTVDELIAAAGLHRRMVKGLLYYARTAGYVRQVSSPRETEHTPDLTLVRNVRAYRLTD
jgi:hypothetical protein